MKTTIIASAIALMLVALATPASANHGLNGALVGELDDGTQVSAVLSYVIGGANSQTWKFDWTVGTDAFTCNGFGSIEIGFTSVNCDVEWSTGPTGDAHTYPHQQPDVHEVAVTVSGMGGTAQQVLLPDL